MAGKHLRNRSITFVEDSTVHRDSNVVHGISSFDNTAVNQGAETEGTVMSEFECNNVDNTVTTEVGVGMSGRQLQDLLNIALPVFKRDFVTIIRNNNLKIRSDLDSKQQAATENLTAKIRQRNEKLPEKLTQELHNEVKKLSTDVCNLRNDTERKIQEVTTTVGGVSDSLNERMTDMW